MRYDISPAGGGRDIDRIPRNHYCLHISPPEAGEICRLYFITREYYLNQGMI